MASFAFIMLPPKPLIEGIDFNLDAEGMMVFTAHYLRKRGFCCKNGCRNCPYGFKKKK